MIIRMFVLLVTLTLTPCLAIAQQQGQVKCVRDNVGNVYCPKHQPVDLSRMGLEGIETANRTRESQARIKALEAQTRAYEAQQQRDNAALQATESNYQNLTCITETTSTILCKTTTFGQFKRYREEN